MHDYVVLLHMSVMHAHTRTCCSLMSPAVVCSQLRSQLSLYAVSLSLRLSSSNIYAPLSSTDSFS